MWSGFQAKKLNTCGELELAVNQAEPENQAEPKNQAELVPGPDPDRKKNFKFFFKKIKSASMPDHHVKGQPTASTYVREKGCIKNNSNRDTPCRMWEPDSKQDPEIFICMYFEIWITD